MKWAMVMAITLAGTTSCSQSGGSRGASSAAASSLTNAMQFNNDGAKRIQGGFPGDVNGATAGPTVSLGPGQTSSATLEVTDDVVATLIWMQGADAFWSLPTGGAVRTGNMVSNQFTVSDAVCDDLCNIIHQVKCYEAAQTADGTITQAQLTTVTLQCEAKGAEVNCSSAGPSTVTIPDTVGGTDADPTGPDTTDDGPLTQPQQTYCDSICAGLAACPELFEDGPTPGSCLSDCATQAPQLSAACLSATGAFMQCIASGGSGTCDSTVPACAVQYQPAIQAAGCVPPGS
jgi:hypothetical protein